MRVAIVTESFFPQVNGVTNTVRHTADRLLARGHEVLIVAPAPGLTCYRSARVVRVRSLSLPRYRSFPVGLPDPAVEAALARFGPDLVHLASPIVLGAVGQRAASRLGVPTVAVYQTDVAGFARQYGVRAEGAIARWVGRLHGRAGRTLVPSTSAMEQLRAVGVPRMHVWGRGVSTDLFAPEHRSEELHAHWLRRHSPSDLVVGYVGRVAAEKQVKRLTALADLPGVRLVVVGDGPAREWLQRRLPTAKFTGMLRGPDLARAFASLDVFVHTGEAETFCQTVQEAQASGVPVVAPAVGGPLDLVAHGRTGLLYRPGDEGSLREQVQALVDSPALRTRLADRARASVLDRTWDRVVDELIDVHYAAVTGAVRQAAA